MRRGLAKTEMPLKDVKVSKLNAIVYTFVKLHGYARKCSQRL